MAASITKVLLSQGFTKTQLSYCQLNAVRNYAAKKLVGAGAPKKTRMEVETDPQKLINYCCGANIYIDGTDPEIKPDSEYPDWLWKLRTERGAPDLSTLDQDSPDYWKRLKRLNKVQSQRISKRLTKLKEIQFAPKS